MAAQRGHQRRSAERHDERCDGACDDRRMAGAAGVEEQGNGDRQDDDSEQEPQDDDADVSPATSARTLNWSVRWRPDMTRWPTAAWTRRRRARGDEHPRRAEVRGESDEDPAEGETPPVPAGHADLGNDLPALQFDRRCTARASSWWVAFIKVILYFPERKVNLHFPPRKANAIAAIPGPPSDGSGCSSLPSVEAEATRRSRGCSGRYGDADMAQS